jgi:hypothetical protein
MLIDIAIPGDRYVIKKESEKILKPHNRNTVHVECKNKSDAGNNWSVWDHCKIIQKILEEHTRKP